MNMAAAYSSCKTANKRPRANKKPHCCVKELISIYEHYPDERYRKAINVTSEDEHKMLSQEVGLDLDDAHSSGASPSPSLPHVSYLFISRYEVRQVSNTISLAY
jgi:hypothetical protein